MAGMGNINDHPARFHIGQYLPTQRRQPALFLAMHGACDFIVKKMGKARHAKACLIEHIQIGALAFQILQSFDGEQRPDGHGPGFRAGGHQPIQIRACANDPELTFRGVFGAL